MIRTDGKIHQQVAELLRTRGYTNLETLKIISIGRSPLHMVALDGGHIGDYNHRHHKLYLYQKT